MIVNVLSHPGGVVRGSVEAGDLVLDPEATRELREQLAHERDTDLETDS